MDKYNMVFVFTKLSQAAIMYPCYMVDYVIKLYVENNLYILKEKESKL
uniref:Uncharacterized protein n=1 Tax=Brassica campestris TaxID=3711 RepID=A0A3P6C3J6_BRACM|nr:unnamed protein product [Brassica rapa]